MNQEATYSVTVSNASCVLTDSVKVSFVPPLTAENQAVISLCQGELSEIGHHVSDAFYQWNTGKTSAQIQVDKAGTYSVTINNGCESISNIFEVSVDNACCTVTAPNIFTPNDDHKNDFFQISQGDRITASSMKVVNRWGYNVYQAFDLNNFWDGTTNGVEATPGIYFWTVILNCQINGKSIERTFKGTVTLQR